MAAAAMASVTAIIPLVVAEPARGAPRVAPDTGGEEPATAGEEVIDETVDPVRRDRVLPANWRTSSDVAWTTSGDAAGFHILAATARSGYTWRTVATLAEPGLDADQWIGNACLTGSGQRLVVVYAPRTFTNKADLFDRGGFTAVVDLQSGSVSKVPVQSSLAYFNPGCGVGETAVIAQYGGQRVDSPETKRVQSRLLTVNAATATITSTTVLDTEVSSPIPVKDGIVAAGGHSLVRVSRDGALQRLAPTVGVPFRLAADSSGGVVFSERSGNRVRVKRTLPRPAAAVTELAEGGLTELELVPASGGRLVLTGNPSRVARLPVGVSRVDAPRGSAISSRGTIALKRVHWAGAGDPRARSDADLGVRGVRIEAKVIATGQSVSFAVEPSATGRGAATGRAPHPTLGRVPARRGSGPAARSAAATGSPTDPVEAERYCSVPRNSPNNQALQPKPRQVEWAVNQAITDSLFVTRPQNWMNLGMPAYTPQGLFPFVPLVNGSRIPAQIMLGIVAQESNMWQASRHALPGVTANPLIGNYYGLNVYNDSEADDWDINWADADCGYGVAQITDGMRLAGKTKPGETALPHQTQRAVALDFTANVAAGVRILQQKWNQTFQAGLRVHDADPMALENWFFAVWAYNSGFYPDKGDGSPWGVGWLNNPINPRYDPQRAPFLERTYDDARTPQKWPYPEKIMGWAGHPIELNESPDTLVHGFVPAWWAFPVDRELVQPPLDLFCDESNDCYPGQKIVPNDPDVVGEPAGPCAHKNANNLYDLRCWYHRPVGWKAAVGSPCQTCGHEQLRFDPGFPYQADGTSFPPRCDLNGLPAGTKIIDDLPDGIPTVRPGCGRPWSNAGTFGLRFASDPAGFFPSKVDFHQIGGGFGGHFYFAYTRKQGDQGGSMKVTGTWSINPTRKWTRLFVHIPDHAAYTRQADYKIYLPGQTVPTKHRVVPTRWQAHTWLDLGVFDFRATGTPKVELSTVSQDGTGVHKIVWDAIAVQPLTAKPRHFVVGMGDSFSSGEGAGAYTRVSDQYGDEPAFKNSCRRSSHGWARQIVLTGTPNNQSLGALSDSRDVNMDFHHIACAGARTHNVMATRTAAGAPAPPNASGEAPRDSSNGELTQIDQGFLDENTTLVVLSIGGNDANWSDAVEACAWDDCLEPGYTLPGHDRPMVEAVPARLRDKVKPDVRRVIAEIRQRAPNAWIVLAGYPQLFKTGTTYDLNPIPGVAIGITADEVAWLNDMARVAATEVLYSDLPNKINSIDVRTDFAGHELGTADTTENWLNGYILGDKFRLEDDDGEASDSIFGAGSFHPNVSGFRGYGHAVTDRLHALGYRWS